MAETVHQFLRERLEQDTPGVKYGDRVWTWPEHVAGASAEAAAARAGSPRRSRSRT